MKKFNFNIDVNDLDSGLSKSKYKSTDQLSSFDEINNYVDLGFPSGILWRKYNYGVWNTDDLGLSTNWYGNYYAWGETKPKEDYSWYTYDKQGYSLERYNTLNITIPTYENFAELIFYTTCKPVVNYCGISGLNGKIFKSSNNHNEIFFPANGHYVNKNIIDKSQYGYYWMQDRYISYNHASNEIGDIDIEGLKTARYFYFDASNTGYTDVIGKFVGQGIRPILCQK